MGCVAIPIGSSGEGEGERTIARNDVVFVTALVIALCNKDSSCAVARVSIF